MNVPTYEDVIEIGSGVYWVGTRDEEIDTLRNSFLLVDGNDAILVDPGSLADFPVVMRKIIEVIDPANISLIVVSHQDPDVCASLAVVEDVIDREDLRIVAHPMTARLIGHMGLKSQFRPLGRSGDQISLASGRLLQFVSTPYLHSPGAIMTYDNRSGSLFTGDIFGSISCSDDLFRDEFFPESMRNWHQAIVPTNAILRPALEKVLELNPQRLLPQYGTIIAGDDVQKAINFLNVLPCGHDLGLQDLRWHK